VAHLQRHADEFEEFCRREQSRLIGVLGLYCGDFDVAEEIAQEAFARVWRDWSRVREKDSPAAWTQRVGINLANSLYRRRKAERRMRERVGGSSSVLPPDCADRVTVQRALSALPDRQRAVLILRFYLDYSVNETAFALNMPPGTVMTHTSRGLARLRKLIGDVEFVPARTVPEAARA
jgi:RNA polymerase sigma-70 factor (sigma-E family)